ncbi:MULTISPECIES: photosystem II protein Psb27 [Prochlorococcus]|uniref:Photosystem II lipoprotein Psb27 n=1 Tax=Prochlorococcus marinus (strain SARG / CCMP1375 / SS120) TaxID=167539 RepID=Q7VD76_PROMA|nr:MULTISPECIES: photosystem II protein Psb27 [Prochlorococcus]AAP99552.1 Photosystem II protein Psb27 [Prochlorococcus marinus subsp. marinus str. CCMP1375]KGG11175.1 Photosystem II protein Psb27 [Prochlorococcus marinus str. LG]KGG21513.1 Photosystem II protein Psb27 [Prochlorococcus marinus str. SS2]KGG23142.1 Photosystem II protein Psb27 [Prochlorococcus marinus str. SS35]KGG33853.1 Photosystem II protein Psb27 [Prochlorococcus marinus str. SS51]
MAWDFHHLIKKTIKASLPLFLGLLLIFHPFGQSLAAAKPFMSGDFAKDTVSVAQSLKETIALSDDDGQLSESKDEALALITAYISRYRNRPQVNGTSSFTTMQTALNAMAGHYKTFSNRPLPENLKERLNKELTRAEKVVAKEI